MKPYLRQVAGLLTVGSLAGVVMNTAVVLPAMAVGHAVDVAVAYRGGTADRTTLGHAVMLVVAAALATELPRIGKRWWLGAARSRIRATLRADALRGVLGWPADRLHTTSTGEITARVIGDVEVVGTGLGEIIVETWDTLLFSASLVAAMCLYDIRLAVLALLPVPVALLLAKASGRWVTARTLDARHANAALTTFVTEHLTGLRILRAFGRRQAAATTLAGLAGQQAAAQLAATRLASVLQPIYATLTTCGVVAVVWLGGHRVAAGAMSVGALIAFLHLFVRFTARAWRIPAMANRVQAARAAYTRLEPLLAPPAPVAARSTWYSGLIPAPRLLPPASAADRGPVGVRLRDVTFTYPGGATALHAVTLTVPPGGFVAVTGPVGSGKSAIADLAAGLYPASGGTVRVDGRDPATWSAADRAMVGFLPQGHPVFSGTVTSNVTLTPDLAGSSGSTAGGDRASSAAERVADALRIAELGPDLTAWPQGDRTQIGEQGVRISGGQRQRIALARALSAPTAPPRLLILDDPFSAIDVTTEARIITALRAYTGPGAPPRQRATVLLCSTRLAAFPLADKVVVLDGGRIAELGSHQQLLAAGGLYARIYTAQQRTHIEPRTEAQADVP